MTLIFSIVAALIIFKLVCLSFWVVVNWLLFSPTFISKLTCLLLSVGVFVGLSYFVIRRV